MSIYQSICHAIYISISVHLYLSIYREEEANEEMRAIHDTEAQYLSEELDARNKEIKEAEGREKQLKVKLIIHNYFKVGKIREIFLKKSSNLSQNFFYVFLCLIVINFLFILLFFKA